MYKLANSLFLNVLFLMFSCSGKTDKTVEKHEVPNQESIYETSVKEIENDLLEEQKHEVFRIEKKSIIFFILSKREAQSLAKEIGETYRWETESLLNGFLKQAETFKSILSKHNIKCFISNNKRFEILLKKGKVSTFDRMAVDQIMGTIISDGEKQPLICYGMYKNKELAELIQNFYNIKNLGYIEPDSLSTQYSGDPVIDSIN